MTELHAARGEQYRIERLAKALRISREIMALSEAQSGLLIHSLEDQKGFLCVRWNAEPTRRQRDAFAAAWELVGEPGSNVAHTDKDDRLEWDV